MEDESPPPSPPSSPPPPPPFPPPTSLSHEPDQSHISNGGMPPPPPPPPTPPPSPPPSPPQSPQNKGVSSLSTSKLLPEKTNNPAPVPPQTVTSSSVSSITPSLTTSITSTASTTSAMSATQKSTQQPPPPPPSRPTASTSAPPSQPPLPQQQQQHQHQQQHPPSSTRAPTTQAPPPATQPPKRPPTTTAPARGGLMSALLSKMQNTNKERETLATKPTSELQKQASKQEKWNSAEQRIRNRITSFINDLSLTDIRFDGTDKEETFLVHECVSEYEDLVSVNIGSYEAREVVVYRKGHQPADVMAIDLLSRPGVTVANNSHKRKASEITQMPASAHPLLSQKLTKVGVVKRDRRTTEEIEEEIRQRKGGTQS